MANEQVMTLDNPTGLLLPLELLQKIGVGAGDQIEIAVNGRTVTVRALKKEAEEQRLDAMMEAIMDRHDNLFRRLAQGVQ